MHCCGVHNVAVLLVKYVNLSCTGLSSFLACKMLQMHLIRMKNMANYVSPLPTFCDFLTENWHFGYAYP